MITLIKKLASTVVKLMLIIATVYVARIFAHHYFVMMHFVSPTVAALVLVIIGSLINVVRVLLEGHKSKQERREDLEMAIFVPFLVLALGMVIGIVAQYCSAFLLSFFGNNVVTCCSYLNLSWQELAALWVIIFVGITSLLSVFKAIEKTLQR